MKPDLKPCPFCGSAAHFTPRQGKFAAYVVCTNESCGIQPESGSMDPAYAKARWNTRVSDLIICDWCAASVAGDFEAALENLIEAARQVEFALHFGSGGEQANSNLELDRARSAMFTGPALAAATGTAKTAKPVECEASQSGPKGNAQNTSEERP